jgi:hypothetical protein
MARAEPLPIRSLALIGSFALAYRFPTFCVAKKFKLSKVSCKVKNPSIVLCL